MKKIFYVFTILVLFFALISILNNSFAATLNTIDVKLSKEKIAPGQEVNVLVDFGQEMGAYTVNTTYDSNIFEYVSAEGGTANDTGDKVILTYHYTEGVGTPNKSAKITFRAKADLTGSNPTDLTVTLEGMANPDASERYDNPTDSFVNDILVEPNYVDYSLKLNYTGTIKKDEAKDMKLITESSMGKNYDHVRLIANLTTKPADTATAKFTAKKTDGNEVDLLQSGWGEADGYALGGKDVKQELALKGEFNTDGKYTVNIKLIDRDDSDKVIAQKSFDITVGETKTPSNTKPSTEEKLPTTYPATGITKYAFIFIAIISLMAIYFVVSKKSGKH